MVINIFDHSPSFFMHVRHTLGIEFENRTILSFQFQRFPDPGPGEYCSFILSGSLTPIIEMSFFMHVPYTAGIDFENVTILLFQINRFPVN